MIMGTRILSCGVILSAGAVGFGDHNNEGAGKCDLENFPEMIYLSTVSETDLCTADPQCFWKVPHGI
jgi:hypothetical protein